MSGIGVSPFCNDSIRLENSVDIGFGPGALGDHNFKVVLYVVINPLFTAISANEGGHIIDLEKLFLNDELVGDGSFHECCSARSAMSGAH